MNTLQRSVVTGIVIFGLGAGAMTGYAQTAASAPTAQQSAKADHMQQRFAKRQAALHDKLNLTAAQEPAWQAFVQGMQSTRGTRSAGQRDEALTAPQRADRMVDRSHARAEQSIQRAAVIKQFYATLSPDQQKVFDSATQRHHGHRGEHHAQRGQHDTQRGDHRARGQA
jgi:hypothetical protein